jgi:uncharacterized protein YegP (UPF0339 family)
VPELALSGDWYRQTVGNRESSMAAKYDLLASSDGQFYFNLKAANGKNNLTSERYKRKAGALKGIQSVRKNSLIDARFDRRSSTSNQPYFVLMARNCEPIGRSEMYSSRSATNNGITSVQTNGAAARVDDPSD